MKILNNLEDFQYLKYRISEEGMDYTFEHYSDFNEIDDIEFHRLRKEYLSTSNNLVNYINNKIKELKEE